MSSMAANDLQALTQRVRAILADPHAPVPSTGTPTLDRALATLAQRRSAGQPLTVDILPFWFVPPPAAADGTPDEASTQVLDTAHLPAPVARTCHDALRRHGRLCSPTPAWLRVFLAWSAALAEAPRALFLPAAVACECMAAGYDLLDAATASPPDPSALAASGALLGVSQDLLLTLHVPAARRGRARAALHRAGHRARAAQEQDRALRQMPMPALEVVLGLLHRRSGTLVAATCQCAALLAGASWWTVAGAGRFGMALGCAAQLEDDLADLAEDSRSGRKTLPALLTQLHPDDPEIVVTTTWVLIQQYLQEAANVLARLHRENPRTETLWSLLPTDLRAA